MINYCVSCLSTSFEMSRVSRSWNMAVFVQSVVVICFKFLFVHGLGPTATSRSLKPDFRSRFSLVASEIFRMGHAQSGETNRIGRKNIFRSVRIWSSNISTSAKFSSSETNQTSFLSHVDVSRRSKNFYKMAASQLYQALEKIDLSMFSKQELSSFRLVFLCNSFSLALWENGN